MNLLIIGGTRFLGRHIAEAALARGHALTLFHRGQTNPDLFPNAEHVSGDRANGLQELSGRSFDAVIDTCGYFPRIVRMSAESLRERVGRYLFISSISVYKDLSVGPTEESPVGTIPDATIEEITNESYGLLKALCEAVVLDVFGERATNVRPGLIVGPHDPTDRFTYWPARMLRGCDVLVSDRKLQPVQVIDVRDLANWCIKLIEDGVSGTFNATGPTRPYTLEEALVRIQMATNPAARLAWTDTRILDERKVEPWSDLPLVLPYDGSMDGMGSADVSRAVASGLRFRPIEDTARDTLAWWRDEGEPELKAGLSAEREREILGAAVAP